MRPEEEADLRALLDVPALRRLLAALRASYDRNGRPAGRQPVRTADEADALADLVGKRVLPGKTVRVDEVDRLLREKTRFRCTLREALELHFGQPIVPRREARERREAEWEAMRGRLLGIVAELALPAEVRAEALAWMDEDRTVLRTWQTRWGEEKLARAFRAGVAALARSPGRDGPVVFLAELGAAAASDPHAFDLGRPAGALLNRLLAHRFPEVARRGARGGASWRRSLLAEAGIARDSISSRVDTYGLTGDTPYLRALRISGLDRPFTLRSLGIVERDVRAWRGVAFVVENPTVFEALLKRLQPHDVDLHPTILCTNGNLNLADSALLDALVRSGARLFYSGDFDPAGLEIAAMVLTRYPHAASSWRMAPADYRAAVRPRGDPLDPPRLERVSATFPELTTAMLALGRPGDQETLIDALAGDLLRFGSEGVTPPEGVRGSQVEQGIADGQLRGESADVETGA